MGMMPLAEASFMLIYEGEHSEQKGCFSSVCKCQIIDKDQSQQNK